MRTCLKRWVGKSEAGRERFEANDAVEVYGEFFKKESVVRASCDDYRAGGQEDIEEQVRDQEEGRKIEGDVLVVYSVSLTSSVLWILLLCPLFPSGIIS